MQAKDIMTKQLVTAIPDTPETARIRVRYAHSRVTDARGVPTRQDRSQIGTHNGQQDVIHIAS